MENNIHNIRKLIRKYLINEVKHYIGKYGDFVEDPGLHYDIEGEFNRDIKDLTIPMVKYHLNDLPENLNKILYAPDAIVIEEADQQIGMYTVYSKQLQQFFQFSYQHEDLEDWQVFTTLK